MKWNVNILSFDLNPHMPGLWCITLPVSAMFLEGFACQLKCLVRSRTIRDN